MKPPTIHLAIRPLPQRDDPQGHRRLRRLLKFLLRAMGFECVECREVSETKEGTDAAEG